MENRYPDKFVLRKKQRNKDMKCESVEEETQRMINNFKKRPK